MDRFEIFFTKFLLTFFGLLWFTMSVVDQATGYVIPYHTPMTSSFINGILAVIGLELMFVSVLLNWIIEKVS